jgi:ResB-like family protein
MRRWWTSTFEILASVRLAVVTMSALAVACMAATFYEAARGTAATQRLFYGSPWFAALLALLAANILLSTVKRYPWTRHHVGFVVAHAGILILLGGSLLSLHAGLDGRIAVAEGDTTDRLELPSEALHVGLADGTEAILPVSFSAHPPAPGTRLAVPGSDAALVVEEYQPNVRLDDVWAEAAGGATGSPALAFTLGGHEVEEQSGWLLAGNPEQAHAEYGPLSFALHVAGDRQELRSLLRTSSDENRMAFVAAPGGEMRYAISTRKGLPSTGRCVAGQTIRTPWMGLTLRVDRVLRAAVRHRVATRLPLAPREEDRTPGVRLRLERAGASAARWVGFAEAEELGLAGEHAHVGYGRTATTLPFRVTLLDFKSETYPGSRMAATYESRVRIDDPELGTAVHRISMNHPLHHRGYTLFQASFIEGERATSILSVTRAPGLPFVYLGTLLIGAGVLWMSFFKRWVARLQARRALAARAERGPGLAVACAPGSHS